MLTRHATVFIRRILYNFERRMGGRVSFHRDNEILDTRTGKKETNKTVWQNVLVIVLPTTLVPKFVFDLSFIASNKNFTYGGEFDASKKRVFFRPERASGYVPQDRDYFVFDGKRWNVTEVQTYEYDTGYLITGTEVKGAPISQHVSQQTLQYALFSDSVEGEFGP